jgi:hypothetical protein
MRDLLEILRGPLVGRKGLMRLIREAAIEGKALDLSGFRGDTGNARFVLLSSAKGPAHWEDVT